MVKVSFNYPIDLLLCILCSIILLPLALLRIETSIRVILSLFFIFFIPGYLVVFALFPHKKTDHGIDIIERIALSLCLSIAIVPLIALVLNYSPWGIKLETVLPPIFIFINSIGFIAIYRWLKTKPDERFTIALHVSLPRSKNKLDKSLNLLLAVFLIIIIILLVYAIFVPKPGEQFTEFYILNEERVAYNYPLFLRAGENTSVILGIVNHEGKTVQYTLEIWLLNQSSFFNETTQEHDVVYTNMWFIDKIVVLLNHTPADIEKRWEPQWEYNYSLSINKTGGFKLAFLLYTTPQDNYHYSQDYSTIAKQKIENAYRSLHLWCTIYNEHRGL